MAREEAFIVDAVRTPRGKKKGKLANVHAVDLLTYPLNALIERNKLDPVVIEDVIVGCVTQIQEQGWCIGRRSVLAAGWPDSVPATTVNRLCGSGQQAVNFAAMGVGSNNSQIVIAGGVENMSRVPMFSDCGGPDSPLLMKYHPDLVQQGLAAELLAERHKISRLDSDALALRSQQNAQRALEEQRFSKSIVSVPYHDDSGDHLFSVDDNPRFETTAETLSKLKTAFKPDGLITAGNASAIVDGAAALLICNEQKLKAHNLLPRGRIVAHVSIGSDPLLMLTGPVEASRQVLKRSGLSMNDIDIWEINEAFAPVPVLTIKELGINPEKVNVNGGGVALGHPLGATGAMLIGTALDELERISGQYALITMCIGLGMGIATIIERV